MSRAWKVWLAATAAGLMMGSAALAAGGGGGGGMSGGAPSSSAPAYDPVQEYQKGVQALKDGKWKDAQRAFDHVLSVAPKDANTWTLMGLSKTGGGDLKGAAKAYERAVKYDPENIIAHRELGVTQAKLGKADKAQGELDWIKAKAAACAGTCAQAADLQAAQAAVEAAMASPQGAAPAPQASLLFQGPAGGDRAYVQAVGLINAGRYEDALTSLRASATEFGPHPDILTYMGFANRKLGRYETAESYYRQALQVAPRHRGALEYYGELKVERGDLKGAEALLGKLDDICGFGCAEAEELRGWIDRARAHG